MKKKIFLPLLAISMIISVNITVFAEESPVIYGESLTVTLNDSVSALEYENDTAASGAGDDDSGGEIVSEQEAANAAVVSANEEVTNPGTGVEVALIPAGIALIVVIVMLILRARKNRK
ncbi:hypothetical protein FACS189499_03100 [Clostridia bacterium]|nr:hypothetical protein FACS189499_03100 [Clostridia bacterium]